MTGNSYEIGAKGSWLDGALTGYIAGYDVQRDHAAEQLTGISAVFGNFACCYTDTGKVQSQGIDAELTGQILPGWQVAAGYTYNINKYTSGDGSSNNAAFMPQTPKHLLKLWSMYQLPGELSAIRLGGGVDAQTTNYQAAPCPPTMRVQACSTAPLCPIATHRARMLSSTYAASIVSTIIGLRRLTSTTCWIRPTIKR